MNRLSLAAVALAISMISSLADTFHPKGEFFRPAVPIVWAATNILPQTMMVYQVTNFSQAVLSNAMAIGSFRAIDIVSKDKDQIVFETHQDERLVRRLKISPAQCWIDYLQSQADTSSVHGVPSYDETEKLALDYLSRFGYDTNQIISKGKPRTEGTVETYDKKGGSLVNKSVYSRGITFYREIDGIDMEESFSIEFGNDASVTRLSTDWKNLQPYHMLKTATRDEIAGWIKAGRGMILPGVNSGCSVPDHAKTLTITEATPVYVKRNTGKFIYPSANLKIIADIGTTNAATFYVECPVLSTNRVTLSEGR
jgi:hypothetical protein